MEGVHLVHYVDLATPMSIIRDLGPVLFYFSEIARPGEGGTKPNTPKILDSLCVWCKHVESMVNGLVGTSPFEASRPG